ncbi:MAG: lysophospholipid acyltransferase family protein [Thiovulaceae bacterium]|nr:lysophospholipid acyltransferase family protein [Sulfurimonadaceae bacterium]
MVNVESILRDNYAHFYQKYPKLLTTMVTKFFKRILHEEEINDFLKNNQYSGINIVNQFLEKYNVSYQVKSSEVENIPAIGRVVIVSNHPLGGMDSLVLLKMISEARQDRKVKIVANEMLMRFESIQSLMIPVNNMDGKISKKSRKAITDALDNEEAVIFFPSGEVSRASVTGIKDEQWKAGFVKMARMTNAPILPIHLNAKNSWKFYFLSSIYRPLGALLLSHEMLKPKYRDIQCTIGELIPSEAFSNRAMTLKEYSKLFKKHLYKISKGKRGVFSTQKCIAHPEQRQLLKQELKSSKLLGKTSDEKMIYLVEHDLSPAIMSEIGRLREFSFRKVGEGTGFKRDLDRYDRYYKHLVLWDEDALEIVGAYRLGEGKSIMQSKSKSGFYMNELCQLKESFDEVVDDSVELGRSFVQPKYWGSRALDYLWQGIGAYLKEYPQVHYLYGPVSISNNYPKAARDALVYFYKHYFKAEKSYFKAFETYKIGSHAEAELDLLFLGNDYKNDLTVLKEYLRNFDVTIPTLFKQYGDLCLEGGVSFSDFGIDEAFGECVDGYIMVDINKMKPKKRARYIDV